MRYNINRKNTDLRLYELGNVYSKEPSGAFKERRNLVIGLTGDLYDGWVAKPRSAGLFDLKGVLESLLLSLGIKDFSVREAQNGSFSASACASVQIDGEPAGILGEIEHSVLKNFDIKNKVYALELDGEKLLRHASLARRFSEPARYPSVLRDISILIDNAVPNAAIVDSIKENAGELLKDVRLVDRYHGGQVPAGKQSLTYRLEYRDPKKTLEDREVQEAHSRVISALQERLGAALR
jgi:phenylalanyl-tRNA synthetase beta chain